MENNKNYTAFNPKQLYSDMDTPDEYKGIRKKVNEICEESCIAYNSYKKNQFFTADFNQHNTNIANAIKMLGIEDDILNDKNLIVNNLYRIIGILYDNIIERLKHNPSAYIVSLLSNLEYNFQLTMVITEWIQKRFYNDDVFDYPQDEFAKFIIESLEHYKITNKDICSVMMIEVLNSLTLEKQSFQRMIKLLSNINNLEDCNNRFSEFKMNNNYYFEILKIGSAISKLCNVVEQIKDGITNPINFKFCKNGDISIDNEDEFDFPEKFIEIMSKVQPNSMSEEIVNQINEICNKYLGLKWDDIVSLLGRLFDLYYYPDEFLIGTIGDFEQLISYCLDCKIENSKKIIELLIPTYVKDDFSWINERPIKKCLIPIINDVVLCPVGILTYALTLLHTEILLVDNLEDGEMKFQLKGVQKKMNTQFEESVNKCIYNSLSGCKTVHNVDNNQIAIINSKRKLELSGEIDILLYYKNKLYVLECKNFSVRLDSQQIKNEFRKFRKEEKKFLKKVNSIISEKESVLRYMGIDDIEYSSVDVIGVYVTNIFSLASQRVKLKYDIVALPDLIEYIIQRSV